MILITLKKYSWMLRMQGAELGNQWYQFISMSLQLMESG
ncbi:hypothetical protein EC1094_3933 [Escherichia coli]|nr:hypothetical protein EC1094_3933 [Escherichia coli]